MNAATDGCDSKKRAMKRFLVFAYYYYYPLGGLDDVIGCFDTIEEAEAFVQESKNEHKYDHYEAYDAVTRQVINFTHKSNEGQ